MNSPNHQPQADTTEVEFMVKMPPQYLQDQECRAFLHELLEGLKELSHG